jgi:hypothetical protein
VTFPPTEELSAGESPWRAVSVSPKFRDMAREHILPIILVALVLAGITLRVLNLLLEASLWEDEIFSVALAESPITDLLLAALRFDTHPPLYYVQLHLWAALADSDRWYILNSTLFSIIAIIALFEACRRIYGWNAGLWAAAIFALMPLQLFFAENVRMYPMLALLQIGLWYVLQRMIMEKRAVLRQLLLALCLGLAVTLTHGLGFFVTFFLFLHAGLRLFKAAPARDFRFFVATYAVVALAALYPLAIGAIRQTEGVSGFDLPTIGIHLTLTLLGLEFPGPTIAGLLALPLMVLLPLTKTRDRWIGIVLVLIPIGVLLAISLLAKPVFIYRTLGLFLPFLAISLGLYADDAFRGRTVAHRVAASAIVLLMLYGGLNYTMAFEKRGYREIVAAWDAQATDDATIMTNGPSEFWAVLRYLDNGTGRVSALQIQPPVRDGMLRLREKLDGLGAANLGLFGKTDHAVVGERRVYPYMAQYIVSASPDVWILNPKSESCALGDVAIPLEQSDTLSLAGHSLIKCHNPQFRLKQ